MNKRDQIKAAIADYDHSIDNIVDRILEITKVEEPIIKEHLMALVYVCQELLGSQESNRQYYETKLINTLDVIVKKANELGLEGRI